MKECGLYEYYLPYILVQSLSVQYEYLQPPVALSVSPCTPQLSQAVTAASGD